MFALGIGLQEGLVILGIVVLLFGSKKLPELGRSLGQGIKEFKKSSKSLLEDDEDEQKEDKVANQDA